MERSQEVERTLAERVVHWRAFGLVGVCVAGGVTLSMMVIGSVPIVAGPVVVPEALPAESVVADEPTTVAVETTTTEVVPESTEPPVGAAVVALGGSDIAEAAAVAAPAPAPAAAPAARLRRS